MTEAEILALPYRPCVGVVLLNPAGLVFAGQRIDNPTPAWQMPQGGIDDGESPETAALRELGEETGLAPASVEILGRTPEWLTYDLPHEIVPRIWKGRYRGQKQKWFLLRYLGRDEQIDLERLKTQTGQLFRSLLSTALVLGLYFIWADVFPALRRLNA